MQYPSRERLRELLTSAIVVPGAPGVGGPGVAVPGAPSIGGPGLHPTAASGPYVPTPTGGATYGALRLGPENSAYMFSAVSNGGQYLANASKALASAAPYYRAVNVPLPNMPTSGDCWAGVFFRTHGSATNNATATLSTLLGVQGGANNGGDGGAVCWSDSGLYTGSTTGSELDSRAGVIQVQRNTSTGFHLMGNAGGNALVNTGTGGTWTPSAPQIATDRDYLLIVGISGSNGAVILYDITGGAGYQWTCSAAVVGRANGAVPLFNVVGAVGNPSSTVAAQGFGGHVSDVFYVVGTFPTVAQAQAIATGATNIASISGVAYWNTLDYSQASAGQIAPLVGTGNAVLIGANLQGAAPIRKPSNLTINRLGSHWVFPLACGKTSGNAWIEGTAPAGAVVNCQLLYPGDSTSSSVVQVTADGSGKYAAAISSPGGKPFYRKVWPANGDASNAVVDYCIMDVGIVVHVFGQSECERLMNLLATFGVAAGQPPTESTTGNTGYNLPMPGSYTGPWAAYLDMLNHNTGGYTQWRGDTARPRPEIMLGNGYPGDGFVAAGAGVISRLNYSVMFVATTRSGHPPDAMLLDGQTITNKTVTVSGSGTSASPYTAAIKVEQTDCVNLFGFSGYILGAGFQQQIKPGSLSLTFANGGSPITVTTIAGAYSDASGNSTYPTDTFAAGTNGASGTVACNGGTTGCAVSLQFSGTVPTGPVTATWTVKQETQDTSYNPKAGYVNGFGVREAVDRVGQVGLRYGATLTWCFWVTAIEGESSSVSGMTSDLSAKYTLLRAMAYGLTVNGKTPWPGYLGSGLALDAAVAAPPMVIAPKGRETSSGYAHTYSAPDICRQAQSALWPTGSSPLSFALAGSWYYDDQVETSSSPHEDASVSGGQRIGRRMAADIEAAWRQDATKNDAATWGTPVFSGGSPGARTVITIPLSSAWTAAHPTLSLALDPQNASASTALGEWYVGGTATTAGTLVDNSTYATAAIGADGVSVVITAAGTTTWNDSPPPLVRYLIGGPGPVTTIGSGAFANSNPVPLGLLYDNRGGAGFSGNEPGLPVSPKFS